ncbi:MAG: GNAT family N-acetyltransferase [Planctomycetota bacterium]
MHPASEIVEYAKTYGPASLLAAGVRRFLFRCEKQVLTVRYPTGEHPRIDTPADIGIRKATMEDIDELFRAVSSSNWPRTRRQFADWISKGGPFLVAIIGGKIAGYSCVLLDFASHDPLLIRAMLTAVTLHRTDAWGRDAFVLPTYRGHQVYPALGIAMLRLARDMGIRRIFSTIASENAGSRSAHKKIGCTELGELTFRRFLCFSSVTFHPFPQAAFPV